MPLPNVPAGIETQCDAVLATLQTNLVSIQATHLASNGRYWQGKQTPSSVPAEGVKPAPDLSLKPLGGQSWQEKAVPLPAGLECSVEVQEYVGPKGKGYVVLGRIILSGRTYAKVVNVGPEVERNQDWVEV
jgi:hypothetical protein